MLSQLLSGDIRGGLIALLLCLPSVLLALSVHEAAHGYAAYLLGDPTAKNLGRLTINPLKHLNPIGFICMLLFGFGWANPVPINTRHFKNPRVGMALSALAGPISNLLMALIHAVLLKIITHLFVNNTNTVMIMLIIFLNLAIQLNISLAIFNLLPFMPLDGSRLFYIFLPVKWYFGIMKYERYSAIILILLLGLGLLDIPLGFLVDAVTSGIYFIVGL